VSQIEDEVVAAGGMSGLTVSKSASTMPEEQITFLEFAQLNKPTYQKSMCMALSTQFREKLLTRCVYLLEDDELE